MPKSKPELAKRSLYSHSSLNWPLSAADRVSLGKHLNVESNGSSQSWLLSPGESTTALQ